jgi:hypothetical protein
LGGGDALLLLQSTLLDERCAHDAAPLLADPPAIVGDLLQAPWRERFVGRCVRATARLVALGGSEVWRITHGAVEYR